MSAQGHSSINGLRDVQGDCWDDCVCRFQRIALPSFRLGHTDKGIRGNYTGQQRITGRSKPINIRPHIDAFPVLLRSVITRYTWQNACTRLLFPGNPNINEHEPLFRLRHKNVDRLDDGTFLIG